MGTADKPPVINAQQRHQPYSAAVAKLAKQLQDEWKPSHGWGSIRLEHYDGAGQEMRPPWPTPVSDMLERTTGQRAPVRIQIHHEASCARNLFERKGQCICLNPRVQMIRPE